MNKEELYIITDESKVLLDLPSPSGITLKWVSNLFNDISKLTCSYSYTFKLPMTSNNRNALELADDIRHDNLMMKKSYQAEFYVNGICLCPNANLYINEMTDSFSCVMTWRVLKAFEAMKNDSCKLNELPTLGKIIWGGDEVYGGTDPSTSNMDSVVYPDYDAGVPHMTNTPPKPCVPVYRLIQMINEKYGVKFNIGKLMENGMGMKPKRYLNNANYYGYRVYDDYVSNGVIPLVNSEINNDKYTIRGIYSVSSHTIYYQYLEFIEKWQMAVFGTGSSSNPMYVRFYKVTEGTYTSLSPVISDQLNASYMKPDVLAVGIPVFSSMKGNNFIKPLYAFQHNTGLFFFNAKKNEKGHADWNINAPYGNKNMRWATRTYQGVEQIIDGLGTTPQSSWGKIYDVRCIEDTTGVHVYSMDQGVDAGKDIGIIGFFTRNAFTLKGACDLRISKAAVTEDRIYVYKYMWICISAVYVTKKDDSKEYEFKFEPVTEKSINTAAGFQSKDMPTYDEATDSYICHFEFGSEYDIRKIEVDSNEDEDFVGYVFLPYFPEDYTIDVDITDEEGNTHTIQKLNLQEGDFVIENLVITELAPSIDVSVLPASLRIIESLPQISCFDFMKSVFYMNGAMPRVERDGKTITAMFYNQLRDRVNDGEVINWSDKLLSADKDLAKSSQFHNTKFAKNNYFEMNKSSLGKTDEEILGEFDQYSIGYGNVNIDDETLKDESSVFRSSFYPAFIQNLRYPLVKVGNTCKIWEGDNVLESKVPAIYGYMVYRTLDNKFEDTSVNRPQNSDITRMHKRMNIFSPFDDEKMMDGFFGYLSAILREYLLVKEQFLLNEIDLRDFDESMPVYLSKYNAYFAVSSIQRDKNGVSTVELIKLPRVYDNIKEVDNSYSYEVISTGYIEIENLSSVYNSIGKMYFKRTKDSAWEELVNTKINYGEEGIYAIAVESESDGKSSPANMRIYCKYYGKYRFTYHDPDTDEDKSFVRSEALAYFDGDNWTDYEKDSLGNVVEYHTIKQNDLRWHRVEIAIPIRNQFEEIVETQRWTSPIFVSGRYAMDEYDKNGNRTVVEVGLLGWLHVNLIRDYTSNQTAIVSSQGQGSYDGNCNINMDAPEWAYPYEGIRLKDNSYSLDIHVSTSVNYTISKYKYGNLVARHNLTAKLRTYYDDVRIIDKTTKTYFKSEFGQYHTIKYECDLIDENENIVKKVRRRVIWFVSEKNQSAIDSPYGTVHDDDATIKINKVVFIGSASVIDRIEHTYTMKYEPTYADVGVDRTNVSVSDPGNQMVEIIAQSNDGFTLRAKKLPTDETDININVDVILEDKSAFMATKVVSFVKPQMRIDTDSSNFDIEALNGSGFKEYRAVVIPGFYSGDIELKSITSSNPIVTANAIDRGHFVLNVNGVSKDEQALITIIGERSGEMMISQITVNAIYKETWSTEYLDNAKALIVDRNGMFYTQEEWGKSDLINDDADGIAVSDGTHRFVIAKKDAKRVGGNSDGYWSTIYSSKIAENTGTTIRFEETGLLITGIKTTTNKDDANTDFWGKANTDKIISQDPTPSGRYTKSAAEMARNMEPFPSGKEGYLGACGEWQFTFSIKNKINTLLKAIGGTELSSDYWTSTQYNDAKAWKISNDYGNTSQSKNQSTWQEIRAFGELTERTESIKRGTINIIGPNSFNVVNGNGKQMFQIQYSPSEASVAELTVTSDNVDISVNVISNTEFELSVSGSRIDEVANIIVRARVNGLIETATFNVTAVGETVVDFEKLDAAHVLIIDKEYNLYDETEWNESKKLLGDVNGIAVSNGTYRFVIATKDAGREYWGGRNVNIPGLSNNSNDYLGLENTNAIIAAVTSKDGYVKNVNSAAELARGYTFPNGESGYLGSAGEWDIALKYKNEIENLMNVIGGDDFIKTHSWTYWTSTGGGDEIRAIVVHLYKSSTDGSINGSLQTTYRNYNQVTIRPFHRF